MDKNSYFCRISIRKKHIKLNRTITLQVFFAILPVFLIALVLQMIFFGKYFTPLYSSSLLSDIRAEFHSVVEKYEKTNSVLSTYTMKYDAPVLVFTEDYLVNERELFNHLSILTVRVPELDLCKLPISGLRELANIKFTEKLIIQAARVGDSIYYEPYSIRSKKNIYLYRQDIEKQRSQENGIKTLIASRNWYTERDDSPMSYYARIIYDLMKDCLINRIDIESHLATITKEPFADERGTTYCVIAENQRINGVMTYFVTIRPIVLSGSEVRYFRKYFYTIFSIFGILLTIAVYIISIQLSAPIIHLSSVTRKLASQDFSVRADVRSQNEVGQLSENINLMANNLQAAIAELKKSAETANMNEERMKRLLVDLAHEFKTPLGIISLYTEVIENGMFEKEPAHYFRIIEQEIENLTRMIDETIQLAKLRAGYWKYRPAPVYLSDLIEGALSRFSQQLMRENFSLKVHLLDVTVIADGRRIEQVLTNLISNAVKYSDEKKYIEVRVARDKNTVTVSICNEGYVSEQDMNRIWERYYRAADDTTARLPSDGIGLEIVRRILLMHNSDFGVRQEADKICFYFSLLIAEE